MPHLALGKIDILQIDVKENQLQAEVVLDSKGVFMVLIASRDGSIVHKRFVQFQDGENLLHLPIHDLERGNYVLSLLKGNHTAKRYFSH